MVPTNDFWDERYSDNSFAYGMAPNQFVKDFIDQHPAGKVLFPADGEGRNSVYAASMEWDVSAFDYSRKGVEKSHELDQKFQVKVKRSVNSVLDYPYTTEAFDYVILSFVHLPVEERRVLIQGIHKCLRDQGIVYVVAYHPKQMENRTGGPPDLSRYQSPEDMHKEYQQFDIQGIELVHTQLAEGKYHQGPSDLILFTAKKSLERI